MSLAPSVSLPSLPGFAAHEPPQPRRKQIFQCVAGQLFMDECSVPEGTDRLAESGSMTSLDMTRKAPPAQPQTSEPQEEEEPAFPQVGWDRPVDEALLLQAAEDPPVTGTGAGAVGLSPTKTKKAGEGFHKYAGKVLRYFCVQGPSDTNPEEQSSTGETAKYKIHYFLADDSVEVLFVFNNSKEAFPKLLKRAPLPKNMYDTSCGTYHWRDLTRGTEVNVFERKLLIVDVDPATLQFYEENNADVGERVEVAEPPQITFEREVPPYTGFGSEEDSLASCADSLIPKPPKKRLGDNVVLSFVCRLVTDLEEDAGRRFVITYFMQDNTLKVYEPPVRNSGIIGGTFLARERQKDEFQNVITPRHLSVGKTVTIRSHQFEVLDASASTIAYIEAHPELA